MQLEALILEYFDLETDLSARSSVSRLQVAADCISLALDSGVFPDRLLVLIEDAAILSNHSSHSSQAKLRFLCLAVRYLQEAGQSELWRDTLLMLEPFAKEIAGTEFYPGFLNALCDAGLPARVVASCGLTPETFDPATDEPVLVPLLKARRLSADLPATQKFLSRLNDSTGDELRWQTVVNEAVASASQTPIVEFISDRRGEDLEKQLLAYLLILAVREEKLHRRLASPGTLKRKLFRARESSPRLALLVQVCLAVEEAENGRKDFSRKDRQAILAALSGLCDWEAEVLALTCLAHRFEKSSPFGHQISKELRFRLVSIEKQGSAVDWDLQNPFHSQHRPQGSLRKSRSPLLRQANFLTHFFTGNQFGRQVDREVILLRKWVDFAYGKKGYLIKSAQFCAGLADILETKTTFSGTESIFFDPVSSKGPEPKVLREKLPEAIADVGECVGTGSFSRLYKASLNTGEQVALKVLHEEAEKTIAGHYPIMTAVSDVSSKIMGTSSMSRMVKGFHSALHFQTDFVREASFQEKLRLCTQGVPGVRIPRVFREYSDARMIVQELASGESVYVFRDLASREERNKAGISLVRWYFTALQNGIFYFDPHPGNFLFDDGLVWVLDAGATLDVAPGVGEFIGIWKAMLAEDRSLFRELITRNGSVPDPDAFNWDEYYFRMKNLYFAPWLTDYKFTFTPEYVREVVLSMRYKDIKLGIRAQDDHRITVVRFYWSFYWMLALLQAEANWFRVISETVDGADSDGMNSHRIIVGK